MEPRSQPTLAPSRRTPVLQEADWTSNRRPGQSKPIGLSPVNAQLHQKISVSKNQYCASHTHTRSCSNPNLPPQARDRPGTPVQAHLTATHFKCTQKILRFKRRANTRTRKHGKSQITLIDCVLKV